MARAMAKTRAAELPDLSALALAGAEIAVRVTPGARRNALLAEDGGLRAQVTAPPDKGRANESVRSLLAQAMGVAPTHLELIRGATSRQKAFRYAPPDPRRR